MLNNTAHKLTKLKGFFLNKKTLIITYILLAVITALKQYAKGSFNNYLIFKHTYWHSVNFQNLYISYPEYMDTNHYGPIFSIIITPFALLPDGAGTILWNIANVSILLWGILSLPMKLNNRIIIGWICAHEALTALFSFQFNIALTGLLLLSFSYIYKQKEFRSALAIMIGTFVKLYGIVGLSFFFFIKNKGRFILSLIISFLICLALPMLISSPEFVFQSYQDWYHSLVEKNSLNASLNSAQDISVMGLARRLTQNPAISNLPFLIAGLSLFALPYLRIKQYKHLSFQLMLLASTLIFTVIFSSGSESPTYIIAFSGVAIWFLNQENKPNKLTISLFIFALVLTSLSPSDLFPNFIRKNYVQPYSLKALPCILIWLHIVYLMLVKDFSKFKLNQP
ncbi:glycosyltransferase family 87 protein [Pseudopedobacter beijingensis]|uniref:Glycosyltransferase family 87 protein n=1 Tax=Pseudopedobacter beijingensis TaxID=1207056 RepID=A0ABW4IEN7_9SPHI